jgi:hypothetical protein
MNNNLVIAICVVCATVFIVTLTGTSYLYRMKQLETTQSIAETKAEQGFKFKFGITKEKE